MRIDYKNLFKGLGMSAASALAGGMLPGSAGMGLTLAKSIRFDKQRNDRPQGGGISTQTNANPYAQEWRKNLEEFYLDPQRYKDKINELRALSKEAIKYSLTGGEHQLLTTNVRQQLSRAPDIQAAATIKMLQLLQIHTRYQIGIAKSLGVNTKSLLSTVQEKSSMLGFVKELVESIPGMGLAIGTVKHTMNIMDVLNPLKLSSRVSSVLEGFGNSVQKLLLGKKAFEYIKNPSKVYEDSGLKISDSTKLVNLTKSLTEVNIKQLDVLNDIRNVLRNVSSSMGINTKYSSLDIAADEYNAGLMTNKEANKRRAFREEKLKETYDKAHAGGVAGKLAGIVNPIKVLYSKRKEKDPYAEATNRERMYVANMYKEGLFEENFLGSKAVADEVKRLLGNSNNPDFNKIDSKNIKRLILIANRVAETKQPDDAFVRLQRLADSTATQREVLDRNSNAGKRAGNRFLALTGFRSLSTPELMNQFRGYEESGGNVDLADNRSGIQNLDFWANTSRTNFFAKLKRGLMPGYGGVKELLDVNRMKAEYDSLVYSGSEKENIDNQLVPTFGSNNVGNNLGSGSGQGAALITPNTITNFNSVKFTSLQSQFVYEGTLYALISFFGSNPLSGGSANGQTGQNATTSGQGSNNSSNQSSTSGSTNQGTSSGQSGQGSTLISPKPITSFDNIKFTSSNSQFVYEGSLYALITFYKNRKKYLPDSSEDNSQDTNELMEEIRENNERRRQQQNQQQQLNDQERRILDENPDQRTREERDKEWEFGWLKTFGAAGAVLSLLNGIDIFGLIGDLITGAFNKVKEYITENPVSALEIGQMFGEFALAGAFLKSIPSFGKNILIPLLKNPYTWLVGMAVGSAFKLFSDITDEDADGFDIAGDLISTALFASPVIAKLCKNMPFIKDALSKITFKDIFTKVPRTFGMAGILSSMTFLLGDLANSFDDKGDFSITELFKNLLTSNGNIFGNMAKWSLIGLQFGGLPGMLIGALGGAVIARLYDVYQENEKEQERVLKETSKKAQDFEKENEENGLVTVTSSIEKGGLLGKDKKYTVALTQEEKAEYDAIEDEAKKIEYIKNKVSEQTVTVNGNTLRRNGSTQNVDDEGNVTAIAIEKPIKPNVQNYLDSVSGAFYEDDYKKDLQDYIQKANQYNSTLSSDSPNRIKDEENGIGSGPYEDTNVGMFSVDSNKISKQITDGIVAALNFGTTAADLLNKTLGLGSDNSNYGGESFSNISTTGDLGSVSSYFESSGDSTTVGYDTTGGTSYGRYQLSGIHGSIDEFLNYCKKYGGEKGAEFAKAMEQSVNNSTHKGRFNTGSKTGAPVDVWKKYMSDSELQSLENKFEMDTKYYPIFKKLPAEIQKLVSENRPLQEMLFSTIVQHQNHAVDIFTKAYKPGITPSEFVRNVYAERATRFPSSTPQVQRSVKNRFVREEKVIQAMLDGTFESLRAGKGSLSDTGAGIVATGTYDGYPNISQANIEDWKVDNTLFWPASNPTVVSPMGPRNPKIANASKNHKGVDIRSAAGDPVYSAMDGTVVGTSSNYGAVTVDHGGGWVTRYLHNSAFNVKKGDKVSAGQQIASAGGTGKNGKSDAYAPHVHFEMIKDGLNIDPEVVFYNKSVSSGVRGAYSPGKYADDITSNRRIQAKLNGANADGNKSTSSGSAVGDDMGSMASKLRDINDLKKENANLMVKYAQRAQATAPQQSPVAVPIPTSSEGINMSATGGLSVSSGDKFIDDFIDTNFGAIITICKENIISHTGAVTITA